MPLYLDQLTAECNNRGCLKIFCRNNLSKENADKVSLILSKYSNIFLCHNIPKLFEKTKLYEKYYIIDLYFYLNSLFYNNNCEEHDSPQKFQLRKSKANRSFSSHSSLKNNKNKNSEIKPSNELEHSFCDILNVKLSVIDNYLLGGVIQLLLHKFHLSPDFNIALAIIRLFVIISKNSHLESFYYDILYDVFAYIYKCFINSIVMVGLADNCPCNKGICLFQLNLTKIDFTQCMNALILTINNSPSTDIRDDSKTKRLLEILKFFYKINEKIEFVDYESFYLQKFCANFNIKSEFRHIRLGQDSALKYHFILPVHIKSEVLKLWNSDMMKSTLQDAFFRALFEGITEPYLFLSIRRDFIYEDTLRIIKNFDNNDLKKQLKIKFVDEEGIDSGGIRKEYFQLLSYKISHDKDTFLFKNNRIWFKPKVNKDTLETIGKLVGIALYNDVVLNIPFPRLIFKKMLGIPLEFEDLIEIEPDIYQSINNLEKCNEEEIKELDLYFVIDYEMQGNHCVQELFPEGKHMQITKSNLLAFKMAYLEFHTSKLINKEFNAFMKGFYTIIKKKTITQLRPKELEKIIMGLEVFDVGTIRSTATYNGYSAEDEIINSFWDVFESYSFNDKKKLLQFITGNDRIPITGPESLKLIIMKNGCDTERLPSSQTCFNTLLLPEYSSKEKLETKLSKAMNLTAGFYLL